MKYNIVSSAEYTYPDIWEYASGAKFADVFAARGSFAAFQVLLADREDPAVSVKFSELPAGVTAEVYTLYPVMVERNHGIEEDQRQPHYPERVAPYYIYDCLADFDGSLKLSDGVGGLYIALKIEKDAVPGDFVPQIIIDGTAIDIKLKIYAAVLPEETLKIVMGYSAGKVCEFHNVEYGTEAYFDLEKKYLAMLRRMHQNMMYVGGYRATKVGENQWEFDFSGLVDQMKRYEAAGMKYYNAPAAGFRRSWSAPDIIIGGCGAEAMSYEAYCYLAQYLPKLRDVLKENGWLENTIMGIADEPNEHNWTTFRALCGLVRKFLPEIKLMDAMSYGQLFGALDIWIPLNSEYDKHRDEFETLRGAGDEIWHYVCCGPREPGYINRFMDYPLLSTRYLHWGNYRHDMAGYLHWAVNCYQPGQNPFEQNCPEHHNADSVCYLPAGDTHVIYPGTDGPWMSIRLEAEREGAEECELLKVLAKKDKARADAICQKVFRSFKDVEYNVAAFEAARRELLEALSE